jgi:fucose 4-O-acetylase-like acetyltransferase
MTALSVNGILLWSCVSGVIVVFIMAFIVHVFMAIVGYFNRKQKHNHEPSLVKEYIKSKKQKICPIIEFKDNEKGE